MDPRTESFGTECMKQMKHFFCIKASYIPAGFNLETIEVVRFFNPPPEPFIQRGLMEDFNRFNQPLEITPSQMVQANDSQQTNSVVVIFNFNRNIHSIKPEL